MDFYRFRIHYQDHSETILADNGNGAYSERPLVDLS